MSLSRVQIPLSPQCKRLCMIKGNVVRWEESYYVVSGVTNKSNDEKLYELLSFNTPKTVVVVSNKLGSGSNSKFHVVHVTFASHSINSFIVERLTSMFYGKE